MNEQLTKQLVCQMKILNFWVTLFGSLFVVAIVIIGFLLWQVVSFVNQTNQKIDEVRQATADSLNVSKKACETGGDVTEWLKNTTGICK